MKRILAIAGLAVCLASAPAGAAPVPAGAGSPVAASEAFYAQMAAMLPHMPHHVAVSDADRQKSADNDDRFLAMSNQYQSALHATVKHDSAAQRAAGELIVFGNWIGFAYHASYSYCDRAGAVTALKIAREYLDDYRAGGPGYSNPNPWAPPGEAAAAAYMLQNKSFCAN